MASEADMVAGLVRTTYQICFYGVHPRIWCSTLCQREVPRLPTGGKHRFYHSLSPQNFPCAIEPSILCSHMVLQIVQAIFLCGP